MSHAPLVRFWSDRDLLDAHEPVDALVERLGAWLDVRQAIALHQKLGFGSEQATWIHADRDLSERWQHRFDLNLSQLREAIRLDRVASGLWRNPMPKRLPQKPTEWVELWEPYRRYMVDHQKQMSMVLTRLRRQLREDLFRKGENWSILAQIDAAFEHAIAPRETKWLATFTVKMERHLDHLLRSIGEDPSNWAATMQVFEQDLRLSLLHELDLRAQPLRGLVDALKSAST